MKDLPPSGQHGFTLMESVVALMLLSLVSVVITSLNGNLFLGATDLRTRQQATQLQQACVDQLLSVRKALGFSALNDATVFHCNDLSTEFTFELTLTPAGVNAVCPTNLSCTQVTVSVLKNTIKSAPPATLLFVKG